MRNDKLNKVMGISSIILSTIYLICHSLLYIMKIQNVQLKYNLIKDYLTITYFFILIIVALIISSYMRLNRRQIKPFSKKTIIGYLSIIISLLIMIKTNNALLSSIIILFGSLSLIHNK